MVGRYANVPQRFEGNYDWFWRQTHRPAGNYTMSYRDAFNCPQAWYELGY